MLTGVDAQPMRRHRPVPDIPSGPAGHAAGSRRRDHAPVPGVKSEWPVGSAHFNVLFPTDVDALDTSDLADALSRAKAQGAFVFWNHPGFMDKPAMWFPHVGALFDAGLFSGIDVVNGDRFYPEALGWAARRHLTPLACSDAHLPMPAHLKSIDRPITRCSHASRRRPNDESPWIEWLSSLGLCSSHRPAASRPVSFGFLSARESHLARRSCGAARAGESLNLRMLGRRTASVDSSNGQTIALFQRVRSTTWPAVPGGETRSAAFRNAAVSVSVSVTGKCMATMRRGAMEAATKRRLLSVSTYQ